MVINLLATTFSPSYKPLSTKYMKKKETVQVEAWYCDICGKKIDHRTPYNQERFDVLKHLVKLEKFDAHEACVNRIIREAFKMYVD